MYFDKETDLTIDTTNCQMRWTGNHEYKGEIKTRYFSVPQQFTKITMSYKVCKIEFTSSIFIGRRVIVSIRGQHALSLISIHGNIEINSPIDISGSSFKPVGMPVDAKTTIGGYFKTVKDGLDAGRVF